MPPFSRLALADALLNDVAAHARAELPNECCGLLAGRVVDGTAVATARFPVRNRLASPTEYETDPRDLLAAFRAIREQKLELLAVYHSHPAAEPVPSRRDVERNTYGESVVHLIVTVAPEVRARAWWLTETGYREAELVTRILPEREA
jgi:proteasome lid subunit RPN8/RPN11